jgi:hypothetical protein
MARFNANRLAPLARTMYESQSRWVARNWQDTLAAHARAVETLLDSISVFDLWKKMLGGRYHEIGKDLLPEIFMDAYVSVHFACMGLYKQAHVCLRAELETVLRLAYFAVHPVEYGWWSSQEHYFSKKDPWGNDYEYFRHLIEVKEFQRACSQSGNRIMVFDDVRRLYSRLSQYVHAERAAFLTTPDRFAPRYQQPEFRKWCKAFQETQRHGNVVLVLAFAQDFKGAGRTTQKEILKRTGDQNTKAGLRRSLALKFAGAV